MTVKNYRRKNYAFFKYSLSSGDCLARCGLTPIICVYKKKKVEKFLRVYGLGEKFNLSR